MGAMDGHSDYARARKEEWSVIEQGRTTETPQFTLSLLPLQTVLTSHRLPHHVLSAPGGLGHA